MTGIGSVPGNGNTTSVGHLVTPNLAGGVDELGSLLSDCAEVEFVDHTTSIIAGEDPLRGLLF